MTATVTLRRSQAEPADRSARRSARSRSVAERPSVPPLGSKLQLVRSALLLAFVLSFTLLLEMVLISGLQQHASQARAFDGFREQLALGTVAIGPMNEAGTVIALGTPVAYLEIPSIGLHQVIGEGTTSAVLMTGPGHSRDTPLPGQLGTSVVMGRRASFGGPFADIDGLHKGDAITVTTGQGVFLYKVLGVRRDGDPTPPPAAKGSSRITLVTAAGRAFMPEGALRVDADLDGTPVVGPRRLVSAAGLPSQERVMAGDSRTLWVLAFWLQALIILSIGAVWSWHRWGRAQTWVVFLPPLLLVGLAASGEAARLLPNLL